MTIGLLLKIAVLAVVIGIIIARWKGKKSDMLKNLEQMRVSDWQGWIEIANNDHLPLFQGKIVAVTETGDYTGALLFGVLVEKNVPAALTEAIKARPFTYLTKGRLLVRGLTVHDKNFIATKLEDQDLIEKLGAAMDRGVKPETSLVLNSVDIQHMDSPEGMAKFDEIWETSLATQARKSQPITEP